MKANTPNPVISKVRVTPSKEQIALIKDQLIGSRLVYEGLEYAGLHYNTLFKRALKGKPIKKEQLSKIVEFCESIKNAKAA